MPMRTDCAHYKTRTYLNGETKSTCELDLAPEAPWRCPENCPAYEGRLVNTGWKGANLVHHQKSRSDPNLEGAADVLGEAEQILNAISPKISEELEAEAARKRRKKERKRRRRMRAERLGSPSSSSSWGRSSTPPSTRAR